MRNNQKVKAMIDSLPSRPTTDSFFYIYINIYIYILIIKKKLEISEELYWI
jgi:hypothetical protein